MEVFSVFVMLLAGWLGLQAAPAPAATALRATFIGNMGVHLTDGRAAVLVDFPYESGAFGYMEWSRQHIPDGPRPLCLFTHSHRDHFAPALVKEHCAAVLGPDDVVKGSAVVVVPRDAEVKWSGITIRPVGTPHAGIEHYSYLVEWQGVRVYFTGDTERTDALLAARRLDAAFVSPWLLDAVAKQRRPIDARQVVAYHHTAGAAVADVQQRMVPTPGQVIEIGSAK